MSADWLFEVKWDGFRALLYSDKDGVRLVSRNVNVFKSFPGLGEGLVRDLKGRRCILDGEIVCLDSHGKPQFRNLLFRRFEPVFYAFDILWDEHAMSDDEEEQHRFRNGEDLRPSVTANFAFGPWWPTKANDSSTATTSKARVRAYSALRANTIWRASWPNTNIPLSARPGDHVDENSEPQL